MPAVLPEDAVLDLFELCKIRVQCDLYGPFPQNLGTEGMDGPDKALLQIVEGLGQPVVDFLILLAIPYCQNRPLQLGLEPPPQLSRCLPGKRHRRKGVDPGPSRCQKCQHPVHQAVGLS